MSTLGVKTFMSCSYVHEIRNHVHTMSLQNRCKKQLFLWKIGGLRTLASQKKMTFSETSSAAHRSRVIGPHPSISHMIRVGSPSTPMTVLCRKLIKLPGLIQPCQAGDAQMGSRILARVAEGAPCFFSGEGMGSFFSNRDH